MAIALMTGAIGCSVNVLESEQDESLKIVFEASPFVDGDRDISTRTSVVPNELYTVFDFIWSAEDTVGIYPDAGSQVFFTMENGAGASSATFDGGAWTCKDGYVYRSYYPFIGDIYLDATKIPVTFLGQKQVGNDNSDHFQKYDYMYTAAATKESGFLNFTYKHLGTVVLPWVELPAGHYTGLTLSLDEALFVTEGEYDLTAASPAIVGKKYSDSMSIDLDVTFTSPDILKVYVPLAPMDMSGKTLTVTITNENGREFQYTYNPSKPYVASKIYRLKSATSLVPNNIEFADPAVKAICVENWDTNGDGELSYDEALSVTDLGTVFYKNKEIVSFNELQYFKGLTSIGNSAFNFCLNLASIVIPDNVTRIDDFAFHASGLTSIVIPDGVTSIGANAFGVCSHLTSVAIPNSLTSLGHNPFGSCDNLTSFIGNLASADERCLVLDGTVRAFAPCGLTSYELPSGVTGIGDYAFSNRTNLTSITISSGVTTIGDYAFENCWGLTSVFMSDGVTTIGVQAFAACTGLDSIIIPNSVTSIGAAAFASCTSLTAFVIPDGITIIDSSVFHNCTSLISIVIPDNVTSIGEMAFIYCSSLESITCQRSIPPTGNSSMFEGTNDCPIYVPAESVEAYKSAEYWSDYADRIQAIPTTGEINGHAYVDMGNGLLWATMNIGASSPEDIGDYFAWGETEPYYNSKSPLTWKVDKSSGYCWESYQFNPSGDGATFSKYTDEYTGESVLQSEDDAARVNWGGLWRIPNYYDWIWLKANCTWQYETNSGVSGYRVTSKINSHSIFLPVAGYFAGTTLYSSYSGVGFYWSSSMGNVGNTPVARGLYLTSDEASFRDDYRYRGQSIRPVSD